jgi:hypothetical protein
MTTHAKAYVRVAERALAAAQAALSAAVQEKAAFLGYHGFESVGGAFCVSRGMSYPRGHAQKVNAFRNATKFEKFGKQVTQLAIEVASLRNRCLYPFPTGAGTVELPESVITAAQVNRLVGRIESLVKRINEVV